MIKKASFFIRNLPPHQLFRLLNVYGLKYGRMRSRLFFKYYSCNWCGGVALVVYGLFIIFYKSSGSFMGDEATYSQIAKESLADNSYLTLHWKGSLWFEKPPVMIWLTALAFRFWEVSETAAHIFPGIFSILSATVVYFLGKDFFRSKLAGFFAGFIFLTSPIIFLYSRVNMLDIPVGMFLALGLLALWMVSSGDKKWWLVFWFSAGMAVMIKSAVGLLLFLMLAAAVIIFKKNEVLKNKFFGYGLFAFLAICAPWHIYMAAKFGSVFWQDYLGFHILERFTSPILPYPWEGNSWWAYFKLFFERSGIWIGIFLFGILSIFASYGLKFKKRSEFFAWIKESERQWIFLAIWFLAVFLPFFFARTKLPNYMVLAYFPLAVFAGGFLNYVFKSRNIKALATLSFLSLFNFLPSFRLRVSQFGEAHPLLPKIFIRYFSFDDGELLLSMFLGFLCVGMFFYFFRREPKYIAAFSGFVLFGMNTLVPFNPYRNEFIKKLGREISDISQNRPVELYAVMKPDQYSFHCVGAFYLPMRSKIENLGERRMEILPKSNSEERQLCFIERSFIDSNDITREAVLSYKEGAVVNCAVE
ncbi:MAG: Dolichyl-phosphate-mannose-protein mannosyltransferase [Patescibacteria group bacterium]|nr:Dolichyl-phosphate-mannose-protein mannosyltransferase [Patescibacteria group bacterium]